MILSKIKSSKNIQNTFWNIAEVLLGPLILFVTIPIFLKQLGTQDYGIWMFTNTIIILLQILNLGLNFSTYKHVSVALPNKDWKQIKQTINVNLSLTLVIFITSLLIITALSSVIYYFDAFIEDSSSKEKLIYCIYIGVVISLTKLSEQILYNVYRAFEKFKYVTIISVLIKTATVLGNIFIAFYTQNIVYILLFTAFTAIIGLFVNYHFIKTLVPEYSFNLQYSKELIKKETNYSLIVWLQSMAVILVYQGDRLLVSYGFGLTVLSFYAIAATLFNHIMMSFSAITVWLFPQIAKNQDDKKLVYEMYLTARNVSVVFSVVLLSIFCISYKPLFIFWLGNEHFQQIEVYIKWFSIFQFFFIFTIIPHFFLNASGNEKFSLKLVLMYTSINLTGMLIGFFVFNSSVALLIGLAISTMLAMFILHYFVEKKFTPNFTLVNIFLLFIPSYFGSGIAYFDDYFSKSIAFIMCLGAVYLIYIKRFKTNFKVFLQ